MIIPLDSWASRGIRVCSFKSTDVDVIDNLLSSSPERVALDLHVGDDYQIDFSDWRDIDSGFRLMPNECVRIRVDEEITTPPGVFGQVCSKTAQSADGLLVANLKIDPNFSGRLEPTVFNAGSKPVLVTHGLLFASVWFGELDPVPTDAPRRGPEQTRGIKVPAPTLVERWVEARGYVITGFATMIATLLAGVLLKLL